MDPEQIPLRDLHLPEDIGWWPLAPGWWLLILIAMAAVFYLSYRQCLKWHWYAARRASLAELAEIQAEYAGGMDSLRLAKKLSVLLRRGMLAYAPRGKVAGLTGDKWLEWLDLGLDDYPFTRGVGRGIASAPYRNPQKIGDELDAQGLIDAVQIRLKKPLSEDVC